jgi:hypothetical protein
MRELLRRVIDCPHTIDSNSIILHFDPKQPGHNALNQLSKRLESATTLSAASPASVAAPSQPAAPADETISIQDAWEAAGGNPGIKATREQLVTALKFMDGANDDADTLGDLTRDAAKHLEVGDIEKARATLEIAAKVGYADAAPATAAHAGASELIAGLEAEQTFLGSCRETCDESGKARWDRLQRVIDHLAAAPQPASEQQGTTEEISAWEQEVAAQLWNVADKYGFYVFREAVVVFLRAAAKGDGHA